MKETEITIQIFENLQTIIRKISNLGFEQIESYQLNDWYYSALRIFEKTDYSSLIKNSFIVRQVISDNEKIFLCYKEKEIDENGNVLGEEKIKVPVSNLSDTLKIFNKSNINCWCELKQTIYVFKKDNIQFLVQSVSGLGNFIEYEEDDTMANMTTNQKIDYMCSQLKKLGLKMGNDLFCKKVYMKYLKTLN
jgi:predicted adenylyl cyclase CyaB